MKVARSPRSQKLSYGDFAVTGAQDCANAYEDAMFDFEAGDTAEEVFDAAFDDSVKEAWLAGSDVDEIVADGLDPEKCYEEWRKAYRRCALQLVREAMAWRKRRKMEGTVQFYLEVGGEDDGEIVEAYDSAEEALTALAAAPAGKIMYGDMDGPHFNVAKVAEGSDHLVWIIDEEDVGRTFYSPKRMPELARIFMRERQAAKRRLKFNPGAHRSMMTMSEGQAIAEYYRLVAIPDDPHSMDVAKDIVEQYGLSLRELSKNERTFDYLPEEREDHGKDFAGWFDIGNGEIVEWSVMEWKRWLGSPRGQQKRAPLYDLYYEIWKQVPAWAAGPGRRTGTTDKEWNCFFNSGVDVTSGNAAHPRVIAQVYGKDFAIDFAVETGWQIALLQKTLANGPARSPEYFARATAELIRVRNLTIPKSHLRKDER